MGAGPSRSDAAREPAGRPPCSPSVAPPSRARQRVWPLVAGVAVTGAALVARWITAHQVLGGDPLPVGPDADDWILATRAYVEQDESLLLSLRYPLMPILGAAVVHTTGAEIARALLCISVAASSLTAWATLELGRRVLPLPLAVAAAAWIALSGPCVIFGIYTIAYPLFALGFVATTAAVVGAWGRAGPWVAAAAVAVAVSSLGQGALGILALAPALLMTRRWRVAVGCAAGLALGMLLLRWVHPGADGPLAPMLGFMRIHGETNVATQKGFLGEDFGGVFRWWSESTFGFGPGWLVVVLALMVYGLVSHALPAARPWRWLTPSRPLGPPPPGIATSLALAWALAPLGLLIPILDSSHHLGHLQPLLAVAAMAGVRGLLPAVPWLHHCVLVLVGAALLGAMFPVGRGVAMRWADGSRAEYRLAAELTRGMAEGGVVLLDRYVTPDACGVGRAEWALPAGVALVRFTDGQDGRRRRLDEAVARGLELVVVDQGEAVRWTAWGTVLAAVGEPRTAAFESLDCHVRISRVRVVEHRAPRQPPPRGSPQQGPPRPGEPGPHGPP